MSCCVVGLTDLIFCSNIMPQPQKIEGTIFLGYFKFCEPCLLTYLLTHSMVQSPSWEANWFAASREIPRI